MFVGGQANVLQDIGVGFHLLGGKVLSASYCSLDTSSDTLTCRSFIIYIGVFDLFNFLYNFLLFLLFKRSQSLLFSFGYYFGVDMQLMNEPIARMNARPPLLYSFLCFVIANLEGINYIGYDKRAAP